jgi:hypothetical protein
MALLQKLSGKAAIVLDATFMPGCKTTMAAAGARSDRLSSPRTPREA